MGQRRTDWSCFTYSNLVCWQADGPRNRQRRTIHICWHFSRHVLRVCFVCYPATLANDPCSAGYTTYVYMHVLGAKYKTADEGRQKLKRLLFTWIAYKHKRGM